MRENLWLNLTDGSILCGRRYFDGSGGNNHAVEHYRETGYPLAVKLGTITPDGAGTRLPLPITVFQLLVSYDTNNLDTFPIQQETFTGPSHHYLLSNCLSKPILLW